jgi:hypothetical protein
MKYFTREANDAIYDADPTESARLNDEAKSLLKLYLAQLKELAPRLSVSARSFFLDGVSRHDGTLLAMHIGDDLHKRFETLRTLLVNERTLTVELEVLNHEETALYTLQYDRIHRIIFDFPTAEPWYLRFGSRGSSPIDDWFADELTSVSEEVLRHEVLFTSGASLTIEFETIAVRTQHIHGREGLPYLDEPESGQA